MSDAQQSPRRTVTLLALMSLCTTLRMDLPQGAAQLQEGAEPLGIGGRQARRS